MKPPAHFSEWHFVYISSVPWHRLCHTARDFIAWKGLCIQIYSCPVWRQYFRWDCNNNFYTKSPPFHASCTVPKAADLCQQCIPENTKRNTATVIWAFCHFCLAHYQIMNEASLTALQHPPCSRQKPLARQFLALVRIYLFRGDKGTFMPPEASEWTEAFVRKINNALI